MGDTGVSQGESLGHTDALERALQIIPRLHSTNELVIGLSAAILKEESWAKAEIFMEKLKLQYQRSATENALRSCNLSSPEHQKLTGLPARLIVALFEHSSVEQRMRNPLGQEHPDIHAVVKEMAVINNVDLSKEESRAKAEIFMEKLKLQYQCSATENALRSCNLSSPEHQKLTGLPARLIVALFEHSSVEQRMRNPLGQEHPGLIFNVKRVVDLLISLCTFDLDGDAALNLYITTLLKQQESDEDLGGDEGGMGDTGVSQGESLGHTDALERALQIIPRLHSTNELVIGLSAAILKEESWAKAEIFMEKLKLQYQRSATENALRSCNLSSPEHQKLTGLPPG
ncbi:hypothetical protein AAFF_G00396720 [Aldrovandia affinis]|uniref:Uncharacterized protein n=1 Tax=Aldrovandia affinis TaxID=143900 RepID=A0AAD7R4C4_9TELE|nr:hypothetical protein AAFF_G00396720 [Aldrovandia affinis]